MSHDLKIDAYDLSILKELQRDSSRSVEELAGLVNLSRNACWRRVKLLEEAGIIKGRVALVDAAKLNAGLTVLIRIRTSQHSAAWRKRFARRSRPCRKSSAPTARRARSTTC